MDILWNDGFRQKPVLIHHVLVSSTENVSFFFVENVFLIEAPGSFYWRSLKVYGWNLEHRFLLTTLSQKRIALRSSSLQWFCQNKMWKEIQLSMWKTVQVGEGRGWRLGGGEKCILFISFNASAWGRLLFNCYANEFSYIRFTSFYLTIMNIETNDSTN